MAIHRFPIGPIGSNTYLIENGSDAIIIDAALAYQKIDKIIQEKNLKVQAILCTHLHFDHVSGVAKAIELYHAPAYAGEDDLKHKKEFFGAFPPFSPDGTEDFNALPLQEGEVKYGSIRCKNIHTPGHSMGGFCFYFPEEKSLVSGDTLFRQAIGRSDFFGGDYKTLISSIKEKLFTLPDETKVYPGHDLSSTIGEEKELNPYMN